MAYDLILIALVAMSCILLFIASKMLRELRNKVHAFPSQMDTNTDDIGLAISAVAVAVEDMQISLQNLCHYHNITIEKEAPSPDGEPIYPSPGIHLSERGLFVKKNDFTSPLSSFVHEKGPRHFRFRFPLPYGTRLSLEPYTENGTGLSQEPFFLLLLFLCSFGPIVAPPIRFLRFDPLPCIAVIVKHNPIEPEAPVVDQGALQGLGPELLQDADITNIAVLVPHVLDRPQFDLTIMVLTLNGKIRKGYLITGNPIVISWTPISFMVWPYRGRSLVPALVAL